ncbi:MAG TPA: glycosyltransferase, partial [Chloroflexota bacterium]|nr:glycosyltransferase [Chloroflexota bacterium]
RQQSFVVKVGIYNQFLTTMGGGERHMGTAAEVLARAAHNVDIVTHVPASIDRLAERFNLDLRGVSIRTTPLLPFDQLGDLSGEYDLWINGSHMSVVPSKARRSILLVMFPFPLDQSPIGLAKRVVAKHIHREMIVPRYGAGFFGPQELAGSRYRWTAGHGQVRLETPWRGQALPVRLVLGSFRPVGWGPVPVSIAANGHILAEHRVETTPGNYVSLDVQVPADQTNSGEVLLQIDSPTFRPFEVGGNSGEPEDFREVGVAVARVMTRHPRHYAYEMFFERLVPEAGRRLHGLPDERAMGYLDTYDVVCPISQFSADWLERYWGKRNNVTILYPPVDVDVYTPRAERKPYILGVGRFVKGGGHEKKQHLMIRAFRDLVRSGLRGWELHLVGGSMREARHQQYLEECRKLAEGLPVQLHVDASAEELKSLYESASIYWHATGYGDREPIQFEHFGITIVEAMAAGCVPIVIDKGAAAELVDHGQSGYLWQSLSDLKRHTRLVTADSQLRPLMAQRAVEQSRRYSRDVFRTHLLEIVERLGVPMASSC